MPPKGEIAEPERWPLLGNGSETYLIGNRYAHATIEELLEALVSFGSVQRLFLEN
jgi:hypothetical protein